jgi:uncharacterized repeat protein (TIGR01451 family)
MNPIHKSAGQMQFKRRSNDLRPMVDPLESRALLTVITVTGTGDTIAADGVVTLREALTAASNNAVSGDAIAGDPGLDRIEFNIPGSGVHTINLMGGSSSALFVGRDSADEPVFIDGYSQAGASPNTNPIGAADNAVLKIEIRRDSVDAPTTGLSVRSGGNTIRGLAIGGFTLNGIVLTEDNRFPLGGNVISGNFIGTDASGTTAVPNGTGIFGNSPGNTIGGTTPADRNVISGNTGNGIDFEESTGATTGPVIRGNFIGTDATGLKALGNGGAGINMVGFNGATIGGTAAGDRNVIAASGGFGIGGVFNHAVIQGNFIGTGITGNAALFNPSVPSDASQRGGIRDNVPNITIGGTAAGAGNIIASQGEGIIVAPISAAIGDALIQGNAVGTNFDGTAVLGNVGVGIAVSSPNATIGGTVAGAGNIVANTALDSSNGEGFGIEFDPSSGMVVLGNSVSKNAGRGLNSGVGFAPILTSASGSMIIGRLDHDPNATDNAPPKSNATYRIEFFRTPDTGGTSDNQQGQILLGFLDVTTDANKHVDFVFDAGSPLPAGQFVTATATGLLFEATTVGTTGYSAPLRTSAAPASADIGVTASAAPDPVTAGSLLTYTITVANSGPDVAASANLTTSVPAGTKFVSLASPQGWTAVTPEAGGSGSITAAADSIASGSAVFTLTVRVNSGAAADSTLNLATQVTSSTADPNAVNNSASVSTRVTAAPEDSADVTIAAGTTRDPVAQGSNLTFNLSARNSGPTTQARHPVLSLSVPTGTTFVFFTAPTGWTVIAPSPGGTGPITAAADSLVGGIAGDTAATGFVLVVRVDPAAVGGSSITLNAGITSETADPTPSNNSATATATVAAAPPANTAPTAVADSYATTAGQSLTIAAKGILANDTDAEGDTLSAVVDSGPQRGTLVLNADGSFAYTPAAGFAGVDSFTYHASDGRLISTPATVTVTVATLPPPPSDSTGPTVIGLERLGFHAQPTHLMVTFDEALAQSPSARASNFSLIAAGADGRFGTRDDVVISLKSAVLEADGRTIMITTRRPLPLRHTYRLTIDGPTDLAGNRLDGDRDGRPGGSAMLHFNRSILAGPSLTRMPGAIAASRHRRLVALKPVSAHKIGPKT